jgi:hypothetical protein
LLLATLSNHSHVPPFFDPDGSKGDPVSRRWYEEVNDKLEIREKVRSFGDQQPQRSNLMGRSHPSAVARRERFEKSRGRKSLTK